MKKLLLSIIFALITLVTAFAADLNPFAYGLKSEYDSRTHILSGEFYVNAPADAVSVYAVDESGRKYLMQSYGKVNAKGRITFSYDLMALRTPQNVPLNWCVEVVGQNPSSPTLVNKSNRLYAPTSVDIDNNPENPNFGTVFCVDGLNGAYQKSGYTNYLSYTDGAGLYLLNADGTARKMPYQGSNVRYGYNGGVVNKQNRDRPFFGNNGTNDLKGYNAFRVRVSDDGRIFVTAFSIHGHVLWEAKKECFSATTQDEWSANTGWHKIMTAGNTNTVMATETRNCSTDHQYCGIYSLYEGNAKTGTFIAGPNLGFDVRGSGDNLKLLMLAGCQQAIVWSTPGHYYCDEYDLGQATLWNTPPSRRIFAGHSDGVDIVNPQGVQVQYDKNGNVWMCQHRGVKTNTTLARVNRSLTSTKKNNVEIGQVDHNESSHTYRRCGAIRFNEDFSQVAIASNANGNGAGFTVYPVDQSTGMPVWNQGTQVNTYDKTGVSLMDFAWDYAGNLYIAADAATNGECIAIYAMPRASELASTPAASKYEFTIDCEPGVSYMVKTVCDANKGSVVCTPAEYANVVSTGVQVPSCTELTLTVTPKPTYKFINWTDQSGQEFSSSKTVTFSVSEALTLTANFEYAEYTGLTWWNLFKNGEDIGKESTAYPGTNERLWRLYQVEFEKYNTSKSGDAVRWHYDSHQPTGVNKLQFNVGAFTYYGKRPTNNYEFLTASTTNQTTPFAWLGDYVEYVSGTTSSKTSHWEYIMYLFFNRTDKAYNATPVDCTSEITWTDKTKSFSKDYGMPEYWRPWWTESTCDLNKTMSYQESMPVKWTTNSCATGDVAKLGRFNGTAPASNKETQPSLWYQWNTAPDEKSYDQSRYLLAWRDGASGPIVHHASRSNMALYASYVDKVLQESDPNPIGEYDATNNDVLSLLNNKNYGATAHNVTMDRKFAGGMYNTICLPFDLPITHLPTKLQGADIRVFDGVTETYTESGDPVAVLNFITLDEYWDKWNAAHPDKIVADRYIEAGKPYLIKPSSDVNDEYLTYSGLPYWRFFDGTRTPYGISANGVTFQGVLNPTTLPENAYILVADNRIAKVTDTSDKILGYRGYFVINDMYLRTLADQGNVYFSFKKPVTTSIPVAPEAEQQVKPEVRKVMYEGKIYILRGDEVYDLMGNRLR